MPVTAHAAAAGPSSPRSRGWRASPRCLPRRADAAQTAGDERRRPGTWLDDLKGRHMLVFDMADSDPAAQPPPLRLPRNYMDGFRDVYQRAHPEVRTIVGISGRAFAINASDRLWKTYALGERSKITDPATKLPAERNIYLDEPTMGVKALQARGTIFWQCGIALDSIAAQLATARQRSRWPRCGPIS